MSERSYFYAIKFIGRLKGRFEPTFGDSFLSGLAERQTGGVEKRPSVQRRVRLQRWVKVRAAPVTFLTDKTLK